MSQPSASDFEGHRRLWRERLGNTVVKALKNRGYRALYVATKEEALRSVMEMVPEGASVAVPGTVTIREIGAMEALSDRGNRVVHHWDPSLKSPEDKKGRLKEELCCDVFLTSSNAITHDGRMVNIDGTGNRLAGMCWGAGSIIYVIGMNKVCKDLDSAIARVRDVATPINASRLGMDVPCAKLGYHVGCTLPNTVCRAILISENVTMGRDATVILVGESLGF